MTVAARAAIAWHRLPMLALIIATGLWALLQGSALLRADMAAQGARRLVSHWSARAGALPTPAERAQAEAALLRARAITPGHAALHEQLGDLQLLATRHSEFAAHDTAWRTAHARAAEHYRAALALRPTDPQTWASLAAALQGAGDLQGAHAAWARALALGPHEGHVQPMLLDVVLRDWTAATAAMKDWATALYAGSAPAQQAAINRLAAQHGLRFEQADAPDAAAASTP